MRLAFPLALAALAAAAPTQEPAAKLDASVLYAGVEGHARTAKWLDFLRQHVVRAESTALGALTAAKTEGFDVVIVDAPSPYKDGGGFDFPKVPKLGLDFTRPTILLGAAGGGVLNHLDIKLDWL